MRNDMAKKLVESPRTTPNITYKNVRRTNKHKLQSNPDSLPTKESVTKPYNSYDRKVFGEYFPPLRGFLRKSVGRPWDQVFSELSNSLKGGGTVIDHVYVHLWHFVERNPEFDEDGNAYYPPPHYGGRRSTFSRGQWYVDANGILREGVYHPVKLPPTPCVHFKDEYGEYLKLKGIWFKITCEPLPKAERLGSAEDLVAGPLYTKLFGYLRPRYKWTCGGNESLWWTYSPRENRRVVHKRQLNTKELKRKNLKK